MNPTMMRSLASRQGSAYGTVAVLLLAFVIAGLADPEVAGKVMQEPRDLLETSVFLSQFGLSGYMLVLSATLAFIGIAVLRRAESPGMASRARVLAERAIFFFVAIAASGITCQAIKHLLGRARPRLMNQFGAYHFVGPSFRSGIDSFPSGHTTTVFAAAMVFSLFKPSWRAGFFAVAAAIGLARLSAGAHSPSDVLAGATLGTAMASFLGRSFQDRGLLFGTVRPANPQAFDSAPDPAMTRVAS